MDIFTAYAYQKIALRPGGIRIVRPLGCSVYQQTQRFSLIRRLLLGNDIVLRLEQTLKAALSVAVNKALLGDTSTYDPADPSSIFAGGTGTQNDPYQNSGAKRASCTRRRVCSKSSSVSPGKPTIISLESVISGIFSRASAIRDL